MRCSGRTESSGLSDEDAARILNAMLHDPFDSSVLVEIDMRRAILGWHERGRRYFPESIVAGARDGLLGVHARETRFAGDLIAESYEVSSLSVRTVVTIISDEAQALYCTANVVPQALSKAAEERLVWDIGSAVIAQLDLFGLCPTEVRSSGWPLAQIEIELAGASWSTFTRKDRRASLARVERLVKDRQKVSGGATRALRLIVSDAASRASSSAFEGRERRLLYDVSL